MGCGSSVATKPQQSSDDACGDTVPLIIAQDVKTEVLSSAKGEKKNHKPNEAVAASSATSQDVKTEVCFSAKEEKKNDKPAEAVATTSATSSPETKSTGTTSEAAALSPESTSTATTSEAPQQTDTTGNSHGQAEAQAPRTQKISAEDLGGLDPSDLW